MATAPTRRKSPQPPGARRGDLLACDTTVIIRELRQYDDGPAQSRVDDCCFTWIKLETLYPADMTVRATAAGGRTITRTFTQTKKTRTAYVRANGPDDEEGTDAQGTVVVGGLGRCVDLDVEIVDTTTSQQRLAHYHFHLCCNDPAVRNRARLVAKEGPAVPGGQVVLLPLLRIVDVRRDACP